MSYHCREGEWGDNLVSTVLLTKKGIRTAQEFCRLPIDRYQGHPMDLFLKISVLQAYFCWLGDVKEIIVLGRKVLLGKR